MKTTGNDSKNTGAFRVSMIGLLSAVLAAAACGGGGGAGRGRPLPAALARMGETPQGKVVLDAIEAHGGWWNWEDKKTVEYDFNWIPYTTDGAPGMASEEHHEFFLEGLVRTKSIRPSEDLLMAYNGRVTWLSRGGIMSQDLGMRQMAQAYLQRIFWMFRVPFNLVEGTVRLEDEGEDGDLRMVRVLFPVGMSVLPDDWSRVYFDRKTGRLRQVLMASAQGKNLMEFTDYREVDGLQVPHRRRVYQVLPDETLGPLTHEVEIRNLKFNVELDENSFDPPEPLQEPVPPPGGSGP